MVYRQYLHCDPVEIDIMDRRPLSRRFNGNIQRDGVGLRTNLKFGFEISQQ
jgi:hypothetical protein